MTQTTPVEPREPIAQWQMVYFSQNRNPLNAWFCYGDNEPVQEESRVMLGVEECVVFNNKVWSNMRAVTIWEKCNVTQDCLL